MVADLHQLTVTFTVPAGLFRRHGSGDQRQPLPPGARPALLLPHNRVERSEGHACNDGNILFRKASLAGNGAAGRGPPAGRIIAMSMTHYGAYGNRYAQEPPRLSWR